MAGGLTRMFSPYWRRLPAILCLQHRTPPVSPCVQPLPCIHRRSFRVLGPLSAARKVTREHWLKDVIIPWNTQQDMVNDLLAGIVYDDENILVLNKPNGLPMHAFKYSDKLTLDLPPPEAAGLSVVSCLSEIQYRLGSPALTPIFSQMRLASGIVILVKNETAQSKLRKYFAHVRARRILYQKYLAVTRGIPHEKEDECKMAVSQKTISGQLLSVREGKATNHGRKDRRIIEPSIRHSVLDMCAPLNCSLVSLGAHTTKWDFLQLFLSEILSPALGDHVYSSRVTTILGKAVRMNPISALPAPQVMPIEMLNALDLGKKETEKIPLHLHCHQVVIPELSAKGSKTLTLTAPIPDFYSETLERLNLRLPQSGS